MQNIIISLALLLLYYCMMGGGVMGKETHNLSNIGNLLKHSKKEDFLDSRQLFFYIKKAQQGDFKAQRKIIQSYIRLIVQIAKNYKSMLPVEELVSEGTLGLIDAIYQFDVTRNSNFVSYAGWLIRQKMIVAINTTTVIRVPRSFKKILYKISSIKEDLTHQKKKLAPEKMQEYVADTLGMSKMRLKRYYEYQGTCLSLDSLCFSENDSNTLDGYGFVPQSNDALPDEYIMEKNEKNELYDIIKATLNSREMYVLFRRFGIKRPKETLRELSSKLRITKESVRQIELRAIRKIRASYRKKERALSLRLS